MQSTLPGSALLRKWLLAFYVSMELDRFGIWIPLLLLSFAGVDFLDDHSPPSPLSVFLLLNIRRLCEHLFKVSPLN